MLPTWFRIKKVHSETCDTFSWELTELDGTTEFRFQPGQFNMLYVYGIGEVPISISSDPQQHDCIVHTIRAVGTVTTAMRSLRRGDTIGLRGPFGTAWPLEQAQSKDVVIITGGIGLAPLRPALCELMRHREKYGNVSLLYGARTPKDRLYVNEFLEPATPLNINVHSTVDHAPPGWQGRVGVVTTLIPAATFEPRNTVALVCGPEIMMRFTVAALEAMGMTTDDIYVSMERNMKCAVGFCGHCQYGPEFVCKDGPVFRFTDIRNIFGIREL
jgi:NAD(P)H-flavin reductase